MNSFPQTLKAVVQCNTSTQISRSLHSLKSLAIPWRTENTARWNSLCRPQYARLYSCQPRLLHQLSLTARSIFQRIVLHELLFVDILKQWLNNQKNRNPRSNVNQHKVKLRRMFPLITCNENKCKNKNVLEIEKEQKEFYLNKYVKHLVVPGPKWWFDPFSVSQMGTCLWISVTTAQLNIHKLLVLSNL